MKLRYFFYIALAATTPLFSLQANAQASAQADTAPSPDSLVALVRATARTPEGPQNLARLDSSPAATAVHKFLGRRFLLSYYLNYDIDDKMTPTATQMLDLARTFSPDELKENANLVFMAYRTLATVQANQLNYDSAVTILKAAPQQLPQGLPNFDKAFQRDINRYQLVGTPAPALLGDKWYNGQAKSYADGTTMIVFTANWCHSCRSSYPSIKKLQAELGPKGLQTVFAVTLDGEFEGVEMTPEQEFEANRAYFLERYGFTWPVAIQARPTSDTATAELNSDRFALGGYPQFVIVDKQGIIRAILLGWDPYGNRERSLTSALHRALGS